MLEGWGRWGCFGMLIIENKKKEEVYVYAAVNMVKLPHLVHPFCKRVRTTIIRRLVYAHGITVLKNNKTTDKPPYGRKQNRENE